MPLSINTNLMAGNAANNLKTHYSRLSTSVRRLASGLRVNAAADDAAGLAIRELMRADVAAMHQGVRNVNDAISMIQVADGALAVIDEKLIRMKELAEQAATGTYDSIQRLIIDSEFQAMASEIERIARATDFNGIKLLDGSGDSSIPAGIELNKPVTIIEQNSRVLGTQQQYSFDPDTIDAEVGSKDIYTTTEIVTKTHTYEFYMQDGKLYKKTITDTETAKNEEHKTLKLVYVGSYKYSGPDKPTPPSPNDEYITVSSAQNTGMIDYIIDNAGFNHLWKLTEDDRKKIIKCEYSYDASPEDLGDDGIGKNHKYTLSFDFTGNGEADFISAIFYEHFRDPDDVAKNSPLGMMGSFVYENTRSNITVIAQDNNILIEEIPLRNDGKVIIHFGPMNDSDEDYYCIEKRDCTLKGLGLDGVRVDTQDHAQMAFGTINDAIVRKDQARAYYGAMQNRLENTITNLTIQAENLQASESRISDVDVATEMTAFVRNQILTQSATAMLGQANSYPHMLLGLLTTK